MSRLARNLLQSMSIVVAVMSLGAPGARAQKLEKWRIDPYTKNDPEAMKRAGIVRFHPMPYGELAGAEVSTEKIEEELGAAKIRWIETAHFRIGSTLPAFPIPASDRKIKVKIEGELERLAKKLPNVNVRTRRLDPWLRVHLFAQRCEETYDKFMERACVTEASFPKEPDTLMPDGKYWGQGPYLGQNGKYLVLMFEKQSDFTRYLTLFIGRQQAFAQRWNFKTVGSLIIVTSTELEDGRLKHDTSLHCHIVWNVVHNLISGYRFYSYDLPVWFCEGSAHWWAKEVDEERALDFDQNESARAKMLNTGKWRPKVRQWLDNKNTRPVSELIGLRDYGQLTKYDHVKCWSVIDWMMAQGNEKWGQYMNTVKGYIDPKTGLATAKEVLNLQRQGLRDAYSVSPPMLEEKWKEWVLETYPDR
ncbi:MAG: hypothetical protein KDC95_05415 [Planctomycetes bacterium]|nr:hypothetical protein [Planctomycetota bacterium]